MNDQATASTAARPSDDRGYGLAMFLIFAAAALIVTGAVAVLELVDSWWMFGIAFAVHVAMRTGIARRTLGDDCYAPGRRNDSAARTHPAAARASCCPSLQRVSCSVL